MRADDTAITRALRAECHNLLDDVFSGQSKAVRYKWLRKHNFKEHMADMTDIELKCLKYQLIMMEAADGYEFYRGK